jgi:hypothetical protein
MRPLLTTVLALMAAGPIGVGLLLAGIAPACLEQVCIDRPVPEGLGGPARTPPDGGTIVIDLSDRPPFGDLVQFRPAFAQIASGKRVETATMRVHRTESGLVRHVVVTVLFGEGSYLWSPEQQQGLEERMIAMAGKPGQRQAVNWMRVYHWQRHDRLNDARFTARIWPGTGGRAAVRIELGRTDLVPRLEP